MNPILKFVFWFSCIVYSGTAYTQPTIDLKEAEGLYKLGEKAMEQQDYLSAHQYILNAAQAGYVPAYYTLGTFYEHGLGTKQDLAEGLKWFLKAAENGHAPSQLIMAQALSNGTGVMRDDQAAITWLKKAADNKNAEAQFYLGMAYFNGVLVDKNLDKAIEWVTLSAEQNYAEAQHNLGVLNYEGVYVARDMKQALKWYTRAAENNFALSQFLLGVIYYEGIYADRNYTEALKWSLKAAEQNHPEAQYNVGIIYYMGYGVEKNTELAATWLEKAAAQNDKRATALLATVEKERTTVLDTAVYRGLIKPITKTDLEKINRYAPDNCFYIEANIAVNVSMEDLLPFEQRIKQEPTSKKNIEDMKKRLPKEPSNYALRYNLGEAYLKQNQATEAARYFDEAESLLKTQLVKTPGDSASLYFLGIVYYKRDKIPESLEAFNAFRKKYPTETSAVFFTVLGYMRTGEADKIKELSQTLINQNPEEANGYIIYEMFTVMAAISDGNAFMEMAQQKPLDEFMNLGFLADAIQKYPDNFGLNLAYTAFRQMGFLFKVGKAIAENKDYVFTPQEQADYNSIENFYLKALQRTDLLSKYVVHKFLAGLYLLGRNYDKSITHARQAIEIKKTEPVTMNSNPAEVFDLLAATYLLKGDTLGAENIIVEKITQAQDEYATTSDYILLAKYQLHRNDLKGAEKSLKKAQELNAAEKSTWIGFTCMYILLGNSAKARENLAKASMPCENEEMCKLLEGIIDINAGKYDTAFKTFKKSQIARKDFSAPGKLLSGYFK